VAQAVPVRGHRPPLALGPPGGQGRRDRGQCEGLPGGGARGLPRSGSRTCSPTAAAASRRGLREACREHGVEHRKTRPYTPRTNGMVERFNGRVQREVLGITVAGHRDLERLLRLQLGLQRPPPARAGRALARRGRPRALQQDTSLANPANRLPATGYRLPATGYRLPVPATATVRPLRPTQGHAGRRARQGRLAAKNVDPAASWRSPGFAQTGRDPVVGVSWLDAKAYTAWLGRKTGRPYRLLSEAEWEYAARGGTNTPFWTGKTISMAQANYKGSSHGVGKMGECRSRTVSVDDPSFPANPFGLYHVHGNAREWVEDIWRAIMLMHRQMVQHGPRVMLIISVSNEEDLGSRLYSWSV
jgi:hypothetical protein